MNVNYYRHFFHLKPKRPVGFSLLVLLLSAHLQAQFALDQTIANPTLSLNAGDAFGTQLEIDGNYMVVGVPNDDSRASNAGMAYLYEYDGTDWSLHTVLLPSDTLAEENFGYAVAIEGDVVVVGTELNNSGRAYIFEKSGAVWADTVSQVQILTGDGRGRCGMSVDVAGDFIAVGEPSVTTGGTQLGGAAHVYKKANGAKWSDAAPTWVRRFAHGVRTFANESFGVGVKLLPDIEEFHILDNSFSSTNGIYRFVDYTAYTSFALISMSSDPEFQFINQEALTIQYADSVLILGQNIYRLDNSGTFGTFNLEGSLAGSLLLPSIGISAGGEIITAIHEEGGNLELVCYKQTAPNQWGTTIAPSKVITLPNLPLTPSNVSAYRTQAVSTVQTKDYKVYAGLGETPSGGTTSVGAVLEYDLDITPAFLSFLPADGTTNVKFTTDTTVSIVFDCPIVSTDAVFQYLTGAGANGNVSAGNFSYEGNEVVIPLGENLWVVDLMGTTMVCSGNYTDAYGLTVNIPNTTAATFYLGNFLPPTFTFSTTPMENGFTRQSAIAVSLFANDEIELVANQTEVLTNATISSLTKNGNKRYDFFITPDYVNVDADRLNTATVELPPGFFIDSASNVSASSVIVSFSYSNSIVRQNGDWQDGIPNNTYTPTSADDVLIAENYTHSGTTSLEVGNLIIDPGYTFTIDTDGIVEIANSLTNDGGITVESGGILMLEGARSGDGSETLKRTLEANSVSILGLPVEGISTDNLLVDYLYEFDIVNQEYVVPASGKVLKAGEGYFVGAPSTATTVSITGNMTTGSKSVDISSAQYSLIANPYAAPIDPLEFFAAQTNQDNTTGTIYLWDDGAANNASDRGGDYVTVNSLGAVSGVQDLGDGIAGATGSSAYASSIPSFQGFFVEGSGSGRGTFSTVSFTPDMQDASISNADGNFYRLEEFPMIKLSLSNGAYYQETMLAFLDEATTGNDYSMDARKLLGNDGLSFYSLQGEMEYAIQALPFENQYSTAQLGFASEEAGEYIFEVLDLQGLKEIVLADHLLGEEYELFEGQKLSFVTAPGRHHRRFELRIGDKPLSIGNTGGLTGVVYSDEIMKIYHGGKEERVIIYTIEGKVIFNTFLSFTDGKSEVELPLDAGLYILQAGDEKMKFLTR